MGRQCEEGVRDRERLHGPPAERCWLKRASEGFRLLRAGVRRRQETTRDTLHVASFSLVVVAFAFSETLPIPTRLGAQ